MYRQAPTLNSKQVQRTNPLGPIGLLSSRWPAWLALSLLALISTTGAFAQTVSTDLPDYPPGAIVYITATGFAPNEVVQFQVLHIRHWR